MQSEGRVKETTSFTTMTQLKIHIISLPLLENTHEDGVFECVSRDWGVVFLLKFIYFIFYIIL